MTEVRVPVVRRRVTALALPRPGAHSFTLSLAGSALTACTFVAALTFWLPPNDGAHRSSVLVLFDPFVWMAMTPPVLLAALLCNLMVRRWCEPRDVGSTFFCCLLTVLPTTALTTVYWGFAGQAAGAVALPITLLVRRSFASRSV